MRLIVLFILITFSILLQSTVFNFFQVAGVKPDLILIIIIINSLTRGPKEGALVGFFAGLLIDLAIGSFIGLNALAKMIVGYFVGLGEGLLDKENLIIPVLAVFSASLFNEFLLYLLHSGLGYKSNIFVSFLQSFVPITIYNIALIPLFYFPLYYLLQKVSKD